MKYISSFIIIASLFACSNNKHVKTGLEGTPLPSFSLLLNDSTTRFNTGRIPVGKPVALFYFSPHCPFCRAQTRDMLNDMDKLKGIQIYMITDFPFQEMKKFSNEFQLVKYPNVTIGMDSARFVLNYFKTTGIPFMAVYGKDKKLNSTFLGSTNSSDIVDVANE